MDVLRTHLDLAESTATMDSERNLKTQTTKGKYLVQVRLGTFVSMLLIICRPLPLCTLNLMSVTTAPFRIDMALYRKAFESRITIYNRWKMQET